MKQLRLILALLLVLAISAPAAADVLIERYEHANLYKTGSNTYRLEAGGPISNAEPFDYDGPLEPESYDFSNATQIEPGVWRLRHGRFGFTANLSDTTSGGMGGGCVRTHPVRKRWDVYYELCPVTPTALNYRQINDKVLELYKVAPNGVRYSYLVGDIGFKVNIRLPVTWTNDTFTHTFNASLAGLTRQGRKLFHEGVEVGELPDPWMTDSSDEQLPRPVQETLSGGQVTLTATGINSLVLPVNIDPTLSPPSNLGDTLIWQTNPTTNYGSSVALETTESAGASERPLVMFDLTGIPSGSTIDSASLDMTYYAKGANDPVGRTIRFQRCTKTFVELQATWNIYSTGNNWDSAGGDVDGVLAASDATVPASFQVMSWNDAGMVAQVQDAVDNRSGIWIGRAVDTAAGAFFTTWRSRNYGTPADRPSFTIVYTAPATHAIKPWCKGDSYANRACLPFGSLFPNQ
jgi:hypothetical protein